MISFRLAMMSFRHARIFAATGCLAMTLCLANAMRASAAAQVDGSGDPAVASSENGKYFDKDGNPTFKVGADGTVDWATYSGFRRYHSECHVCHGPEGEGSSYAPALKESLRRLSYADYAAVVTNGRINVSASSNNVMPAFGLNTNVMCYMDDIFVYLRARANEAVPRGRPPGREDKTAATTAAENSCLGQK